MINLLGFLKKTYLGKTINIYQMTADFDDPVSNFVEYYLSEPKFPNTKIDVIPLKVIGISTSNYGLLESVLEFAGYQYFHLFSRVYGQLENKVREISGHISDNKAFYFVFENGFVRGFDLSDSLPLPNIS